MIRKILSAYELCGEFRKFDRDYFSMSGYQFLLDEYEEDKELDVEELCGTWSEYGEDCGLSFGDMVADYGELLPETEWYGEKTGNGTMCPWPEWDTDIQEEYIVALAEEMKENTSVFRLDNGNYMVVAH